MFVISFLDRCKGRTVNLIYWQTKTEAPSVWTMFCLLKMSVMFVTLNSSLKIGVTVVCECECVSVTARSAVCLWWWRRLPGPCWHRWYKPTDRPSTPSTASPTEQTHPQQADCAFSDCEQCFWEWEHRDILWCIYFEEQIKPCVLVIQCQY